MEVELVNNVVLGVAGEGLEEFNEEGTNTTDCGIDEGIWTVSGETLVDVAGFVASS